MISLKNIGCNSVLDPGDVTYLNTVVDVLQDHGEYVKASYVGTMIKNSSIRHAAITDETGIFDFDTLVAIAKRNNGKDESAWNMYEYDIVGHIIHNINSTIVSTIKLDSSIRSFTFKYDYRKLFNDSKHYPPFHKPDGLRQIASTLMNKINSNPDWKMKVKKCNSTKLEFVISVSAERIKIWSQ